jgi:tricorn protease
LKEKKESTLGANIRFAISANKEKMLIKQGSQFAVVNLPTGPVSMKDALDLSNMKIMVNYQVEWKQIYHEAWRQMRDFFYVKNMHGVDWPATRDKYAALLPHVNHRDDLTYIMGEMIGELNVGHAYVNSPSKKYEQVKTGLLGAELKRTGTGAYQIQKILPGANWSPKLTSPLNQAGIDIDQGDYILAINEQPVKNVKNVYSLLLDEVGNTVQISWSGAKNARETKISLVQPIRDESELYYHEWVQENILKVSQATGGKVGYLHIPDMISHGLNEFAEHFYPQLDKKALIIDARGNGGGNVSPMIIERLRRTITRATMRRNIDHPEPVPSKMMLGPMILLIDKYTASDGDLFAYSFKKHGLGPVIGERSWGGVVGISGSLPFVDGSELRKPEFASYSAEQSEWIIEGHGVEPDITVINDPVKEFQGQDAQLQKAIELIQQNLDQYHELPPIPPPPVKTKQE